jgi:two-component system CheB/CheR fusion protein
MKEESDISSAHPAFDPMNLCGFFSARSTQAMVAVEGKACTVRHVNEAFLRLAGTSRSQLMGRSFAQAVPEGESNRCIALLERVCSTGKPESLAEQQHGSTPSVFWSYAAWPIRGRDRTTVGAMLQVSDSTEIAVFRRQAVTMNEALVLSGIRQHELIETTEALNARLQAALNEKEYFIAVLSHELRTPLAPVLIASSMLLQDPTLAPDTRSVIEMIHRNITLEARLIDDLLDTTQMEHGKLNLDRRPVDLRGVLERSVAMCAGEIEDGRFTVEIESEDVPEVLQADANRLLQVFCNLIRNAIKFTHPGGSILIRSRCDREWCIVEIADNGMGIDPEFLPRVFSTFEQRDKPHTRKGGLGLGLAICKMIVELHGGSITARSQGKDRGSTFTVRLPVAAASVIVQEKPPAAERTAEAKPLRILLVEDHADTARIMSRVLQIDGHSVQCAGDVANALRLAAEHEYDLLLSDVGLPDGNGWDLMRVLRGKGSKLPGIVLSGYGQDQDIERSYEAGFGAHLVKPLTLEAIRNAIGSISN